MQIVSCILHYATDISLLRNLVCFLGNCTIQATNIWQNKNKYVIVITNERQLHHALVIQITMTPWESSHVKN